MQSLVIRALSNAPCGNLALSDEQRSLSYSSLRDAVTDESRWLQQHSVERCALLADNGAGWVIADLALLQIAALNVPVPGWFTPAQIEHIVENAGADWILTDSQERAPLGFTPIATTPHSHLTLLRRERHARTPHIPAGVVKVTYTSGSTGTPKGVCLTGEALEQVARSIAFATPLSISRHLCTMPLATLLENIAGVYASLLLGASCVVPSARTTGLAHGALNAQTFLDSISRASPHSLILVPELLRLNLSHLNAVITGASGGIGGAIAAAIIHHGGSVVITGRDQQVLSELARTLDPSGQHILALAADVTRPDDRRRLCEAAMNWRGGVNTLINNAGVSDFGMFTAESPADIERAFAVNTLAPLQLCRALLPHLLRQPQAHIVNVGSVFGAIAYPGHAVYSATKFALRGFSEALRRELSGTNVRIHYLAPRATRTKFNSSAVEALNDQFGIAMDQPARVAECLCRMLERGQAESVIGWPEKFFARLNALLPRLVDRALAKQLPAIREWAAEPDPEPCQIPSLSRRAT